MYTPKVRNAVRMKKKASIMLEGLSGRGKTGLALALAYYLSGKNWEKVGFIDTENGSAELFIGLKLFTEDTVGSFKYIPLMEEDGYSPENYKACIDALIREGCTSIVIDSMTHAWSRTGGILDTVSDLEENNKSVNKFNAWGQKKVVNNQNILLEMIRNDKVHLITTVRTKEKFSVETGADGKTKIVSLGEQQIMKDGIKFEPDLVLTMLAPSSDKKGALVRVAKTRYPMWVLDGEYELSVELIEQTRKHLEEGADPYELIKEQEEMYRKKITDVCGENQGKRIMLNNFKQQIGLDPKTKISNIGLKELKLLYKLLTD